MTAWSKRKSNVIKPESADVVQMTHANYKLRTALAIAIAVVPSLSPCMAYAQSAGTPASTPALSTGFKFVEMSGEELFVNVCRGCHMSDGKGAAGAGTYPSLAGNRNLQAEGKH